MLEQIKDEEAKKFHRYNVEFNFNILVRIKESMVDVSSRCMELVLKVLHILLLNKSQLVNLESIQEKNIALKLDPLDI